MIDIVLNPFTNFLFCTIMKEIVVCEVEITTFSGGMRSHVSVRGSFKEEKDGFTVSYLQDGDMVSLIAHGQTLRMVRNGETSLTMTFAENMTGAMELRMGENIGIVPIETERCRINAVRDGWRLALRYRLHYTQECQIFHGNIAVKFISEEQ